MQGDDGDREDERGDGDHRAGDRLQDAACALGTAAKEPADVCPLVKQERVVDPDGEEGQHDAVRVSMAGRNQRLFLMSYHHD